MARCAGADRGRRKPHITRQRGDCRTRGARIGPSQSSAEAWTSLGDTYRDAQKIFPVRPRPTTTRRTRWTKPSERRLAAFLRPRHGEDNRPTGTKAEADVKAALKLVPDQPQVLNYPRL